MDAPPTGYPIHQKPDGNWYVSMDGTDEWTLCKDEAEALVLAMAPTLHHQAVEMERSGEEFACELEQTAQAMARHERNQAASEFRAFAKTARQK